MYHCIDCIADTLYQKDVSIPLCVRTYGQMVIDTSPRYITIFDVSSAAMYRGPWVRATGVRATGVRATGSPSDGECERQGTEQQRGPCTTDAWHVGCGCRASAAGVAHRLRVSRIGCERRGGRRATRTWRPAQREGSRLSSSARFERSDEQSNAPSACDRHHTHSPPHACALATARATRRSGRRYNGVRICTRLTCLM